MAAHRFLALIALPFAAACAAPQMPVAPALLARASAMPLEAETGPDMDTRLRFGPFEVHGIVQDAAASLTEDNMTSRQQAWSYWVTDAEGNSFKAECESIFRGGSASGIGATRLSCKIADALGAEKWELSLAGTSGDSQTKFGEIAGKKQRLRIQSAHAPNDPAPVGFDISLSERPVAAVQTHAAQTVWMDRALKSEVRAVVAASAAGLMLFDRISR